MTIVCTIHGEFEQTPVRHLKGDGCPSCIYDNRKLTLTDIIERANIIHDNKYDYSLIKYRGSHHKIKIICPEHGIFEQKVSDHIGSGRGCPKCGGTYKSNTDEFMLKAKEVHGDTYDYSLVKYDICTKKVKIICNKHGIFRQSPTMHLRGNGCPNCKKSKGRLPVIII